MFVRRFAIALSIVFCGSLALAAAGIAAGGFGPGKYSFENTSADAFFGMGSKGGPPAPSWSVAVNHGLNSFKNKAGAPYVTNNTVVFVTEFDASGGGGFGCFVIPDGDFVVVHDLQSASLNASLTADEECGGYGGPVGGGKDAVFAGGKGGGLPLPLSVDVAWGAFGAITTNTNSFTTRCLNFIEDAKTTVNSTSAAASGSISALLGSFNADFSDISRSDGNFDVTNTPQAACLGY
ncbi:MAG TPA: hypothetical protein VKE27_12470 [Candidatus Dormibacteraeota bacterium]|nr:hypothetical protein [Candidatus Dormibacteraeota bacterium]